MAVRREACLAAALLSLAACTDEAPGNPQPEATPIECALAGSAEFAADCTMERDTRDGRKLLIVRHPDGAFRRLELGVEGRGIVAADGADRAVTQQSGDVIEVSLGPDRYRLPLAE